jgi:hypothetical protein
MRVRTIVVVAMVVGTAAAICSGGSSFAKTFWFLFWAGIVGVVLSLARFGRAPDEITHMEIVDLDPWVDQDGVRHFPGDVFDIPNHPRTGAHGHL